MCVPRKRIFCFYCLQSYQKGLLTFTKKYDNAFIHHGFQNWKKVRAVRWFAIMADEMRDISNDEQLAIVIRWVDMNYEIHEDLIGMVHVPATNSATLTAAIKDVLIRCILPLELCRGQAYDGAANMMGHLSGVAKQLQDEQPAAIKVHCLAHSLNLCLQETAKKCQPIRTALENTMELCKLIRYSPKRTNLLQECKQELSIGGTGLRPLCPTRWTVRTGAINAVIKNYPAILQALQITVDTSYDDYGRRANGLLAQLQRFDTYFGLKLSYLVFSGTEQTSINLQSKNTSVQDALSCAEVARSYTNRLRCDCSFEEFYAVVVKEAQQCTEEPTLPRYRRPPKRLDQGAAPHQFNSVEDYYRSLYFQVLDLVSEQILSRFSQESMSIPKELENIFIRAANHRDNIPVEIPDNILTMYSKDVNFERAVIQLQMLPDAVKTYRESQGLREFEVTSVRTIADILNKLPMMKQMFSEVDSLLHLYFTIPVTTCTAERSFSCLRRIKTYLRSSMTEERLNNVILLHVHKEEVDNLDLQEIASDFISVNDRRLKFFGTF